MNIRHLSYTYIYSPQPQRPLSLYIPAGVEVPEGVLAREELPEQNAVGVTVRALRVVLATEHLCVWGLFGLWVGRCGGVSGVCVCLCMYTQSQTKPTHACVCVHIHSLIFPSHPANNHPPTHRKPTHPSTQTPKYPIIHGRTRREVVGVAGALRHEALHGAREPKVRQLRHGLFLFRGWCVGVRRACACEGGPSETQPPPPTTDP